MRTYIGIALLSAAMLLLQLALLRVFAVQQFYHFAFMAISLALLGNGASGSLLSLWPRRYAPALLCLAFSLTTLAAYLTINYLPFDSFSIAWDRRQVLYLAVYFLAAAVPFLFAGLLIGSELMGAGRTGAAGSHRVYGANLIGAALGSVGSLPALMVFGGEGTVVLATVVGAGAGLCLSQRPEFPLPPAQRELAWPRTLRGTRRNKGSGERSQLPALMLALALTALVLTGIAALLSPPALLAQQLSPYKTLSVLTQALNTRRTFTASDATARVDVVESSTIHVMPGLSLASPVGPPAQAGLLLDGDNLMPLTNLAPDAEPAQTLADHMPLGLLYRLRPQGRTLVIEAGTGLDVLLALAAGAAQVTAVEDNGLILDVMRHPYQAFTHGLYHDPRVTVIHQTGRTFVRQPGVAPYDVIIVALTDPHRPVTSGAYTLTENYVYTVEAFRDYLHTLAEDGVLMVTRWLQSPPSECSRTFGTLAAALAATGRDPATHLLAFRTLRTMTILASPRPFSPSELEQVRTFLRQRGFDAVYYAGILPAEVNRYNRLPQPVYSELFQALLNKPEATYAGYYFDIRPPTDNHPFFFHYFRWRQTPDILATLGLTWQPFGGSGFFVLVALLVLVALAATIFIVGPLLLRRRTLSPPPPLPIPFWRVRVFVYFAALGLAYLFVELALAQRFILVFGQPVTALAVVIFTLLLFSGVGSLTLHPWARRLGLLVLVVSIGVYPLLLGPVSALALQWSEWGRTVLTLLVLAPLGYLMGLPFASGLRLVEAVDPTLVPWAWAINGSFSVISAVLAVLVALSWGFAAVLWLGASAYAAALVVFGWVEPAGPSAP